MSYPVTDNEINDVAPAQTGGAVFDVKKFIFKLIGFLPWIIMSMLIAYSIATLYLRYTSKVYRVTAQILIKDDQAGSPDYNIVRDLGVMPGSKEIQDQIDILQSYEMAKTVVDSLHLQIQMYAQGRIASAPLYGSANPVIISFAYKDTADFTPGIYKLIVEKDRFSLQNQAAPLPTYHNYGDTFNFDNHKVYVTLNKDVKPANKGYALVVTDTRTVATGIKNLIAVTKPHEMGGTLEIAINDEVPAKAIDILNVLIESFTRAGKEDKSIGANKTKQFLKEKVEQVEGNLNAVEIAADSFKSANKIVDISEAGNQYLSETQSYEKARLDQDELLRMLNALAAYIQNAKNLTDIIPSNNGISDAVLNGLIAQYNLAVIEYNTQLRISAPEDPILAQKKANILNYKESLLKNIQSIKIAYQAHLDLVTQQYNKSSGLLQGLPEKERVLVNLKRQIAVQEQLYNFLLQKQADAELSLASVTADSRIVDYAHDQGIISPKAGQIKMFSIIIGVILPIIVMLMLDFFNNRISERREVEDNTRVPLIGELSYNNKQKNIIVNPQSRSVLAEQFRLIRTNLQYLANDQKAKTMLVTSFMSGEGKSFVSLNLAGSLVTGDKKVLLLELDLRKPKLAKYLELQSNRGLTDYIVNRDLQLKDVISKIPGNDHIDVITSGLIPPNPTELIMSERFNDLLKTAKETYDFIVIDSSPVGLVADAFIVGHAVDVTLFIVRHKYSYKTTISFIEKLYADKKLNRLSIVMNGIIASSGLGYGYGYGYGYSYGYGYHYGGGYYTEEQSKGIKGFFDKLFKK